MKVSEYKEPEIVDKLWDPANPPKSLATAGNVKVGAMTTFNTLAFHACPGRTSFCVSVCYDIHSLKTLVGGMKTLQKAAYSTHLVQNDIGKWSSMMKIDLMNCGTEIVRIHVGGDFMSEAHIKAWGTLMKAFPHKTFFAYTRSWAIANLRVELNKLRSLPNFTLFASVDPSTDQTTSAYISLESENWRKAYIVDNSPLVTNIYIQDIKTPTIVCPEQLGKVGSCLECGWCFKEKLSKSPLHVKFLEHGKGKKLPNKKGA